ncbi:MAG: multidrug efflux SMR transporter [Novosphingobium sp.]|nr:multidrug efflux SMR transporter [Novosphingobium sp.]
MNAWFLLGLAIALEVAGTLMLKLSDGFTKVHFGLMAIGLYGLCFWVFAPALKVLPVGVAYAVWSGAGIVAATAIGYALFGEQLGMARLLFIAMILAGAVGLQMTTPG